MNEIVELLDLGEAFDRLLRDVSGGEKRRLSLAATLIHGPELMFLDEPTAGIDPILRTKFWDHFEHLSEQGSTLDGHDPICGRGRILRSRRGCRQGAGDGPWTHRMRYAGVHLGRLVRRGPNRPTGA